MYFLASSIIHLSILISSHIVNHNYCIYLHKILIAKTRLTIENNLFDYETFYLYNSYIIYKIYIIKKSKKLKTSWSKAKTKSRCDHSGHSLGRLPPLSSHSYHTRACGISSVWRLVPFAALLDRHCLRVCCCCGACFRCCPPCADCHGPFLPSAPLPAAAGLSSGLSCCCCSLNKMRTLIPARSRML